nr:uncharacterized protein LOC111510851 [Leptinotarsa decemlineata]
MIRHLLIMSGLSSSCTTDCSGRGECYNGTCMCDIRFTGDLCDGPNFPYHVGIGGVFFFISFTCAVQLIICITSEYVRLKAPSLVRACKVTNQKLIYLVICIASMIRGAYFIFPESLEYDWSSSLLSAYYPLLMSSASLIICYWAEVFHVPGIRWDKPQFLSKSYLGFITFNLINYGLLLAEFITVKVAKPPPFDPGFYHHFFNGCYAVLMFIVVVFIKILKVRGGFIAKPLHLASGTFETEPLQDENNPRAEFNISQLNQSRIGLLSQALMLIIVSGFLFSETLSAFWKKKVPINSRNLHHLIFRVVEIGVAIWYPAVLWNCMQPAELWILNPRKLLAKLDQQKSEETIPDGNIKIESDDEAFLDKRECWICYDMDKKEKLIQPCDCTGDVSSVHHECLRRWLMESASSSSDPPKCKVCKYEYDICKSEEVKWDKGFTAQHWGSTAFIVTFMCLTVAGAWTVIQLYDNSYIRMVSVSCTLIIIYICVRFLGQNTLSAYQRAKVAALSIKDHVTTISGNVMSPVLANTQSEQVQTAL